MLDCLRITRSSATNLHEQNLPLQQNHNPIRILRLHNGSGPNNQTQAMQVLINQQIAQIQKLQNKLKIQKDRIQLYKEQVNLKNVEICDLEHGNGELALENTQLKREAARWQQISGFLCDLIDAVIAFIRRNFSHLPRVLNLTGAIELALASYPHNGSL